MNIIGWILFGLITGVIANAIDPQPAKGGWVGAIILGISGALVGGFLGNLVFNIGITGFNFPSFAVSVLGALFLLFVGRALGKA